MAIPRRPGPAQVLGLLGQIPDFPELPEKFVERFPELKSFAESTVDWWSRFSVLLQRDRDQLAQILSTSGPAVQSQIDALKTSVSDLQAQVNAISGADLSGIQAQLNEIAGEVAALTIQLNGHVGSSIAHNTLSNIVGESDEQSLDRKTIGSGVPRYGRFTAGAVGRGRILSGETITVGPNDFLVVAGPLDISGQLVIEGTLVAV